MNLLPKVKRLDPEMEEVSDFVSAGIARLRSTEPPPPCAEAGPTEEGHLLYGLSRLYKNLGRSMGAMNEGNDAVELKAFKEFTGERAALLGDINLSPLEVDHSVLATTKK